MEMGHRGTLYSALGGPFSSPGWWRLKRKSGAGDQAMGYVYVVHTCGVYGPEVLIDCLYLVDHCPPHGIRYDRNQNYGHQDQPSQQQQFIDQYLADIFGGRLCPYHIIAADFL